MALLSDIHICISAKNVLWNDADNIPLNLSVKILKYILSAKYVLSHNFKKAVVSFVSVMLQVWLLPNL